MMKATTEITCHELRPLWAKAVAYSRLNREYAWKHESLDKPWWRFWKTEYDESPIDTDVEYWNYLRDFYPWNEIDGFSSISEYQSDRVIKISVKLFAAIVKRAKKWDEGIPL